MGFSSLIFLTLFLPVVIGLHLVLPGKARNGFLLLASLFFYAWGEGEFLLLMLGSILANYLFGLLIGRVAEKKRKKRVLALAIVANLGALAFFKYAHLLADTLNPLLFHWGLPLWVFEPIHLPLGISFFTFQALSYLIDLYRGAFEVQKNPFHLGLYISLFPQLVAGPIVRYQDWYGQLKDRHIPGLELSEGASRFVIGLAKKVLIADQLAPIADKAFSLAPEQLSPGLAWLGILCYSLQIYFDFSGYSDMAIGLGRMLGFQLPENFNYPYISRSIREFWRRWHISLSTWFRDYLYLPLGGNRLGNYRTYFNLATVFVLCGLWHGANWAFLFWGIYHGFWLMLERGIWGKRLERSSTFFRWCYVWLVVMIGWVFFRAENWDLAIHYLAAMTGMGPKQAIPYPMFLLWNTHRGLALLMGLMLSAPLYLRWTKWSTARGPVWKRVEWALGLVLLVLCLTQLVMSQYHPFIYFRF
ncbi:MAG: MBOAT family protein [Bacteroidota bacterium]